MVNSHVQIYCCTHILIVKKITHLHFRQNKCYLNEYVSTYIKSLIYSPS